MSQVTKNFILTFFFFSSVASLLNLPVNLTGSTLAPLTLFPESAIPMRLGSLLQSLLRGVLQGPLGAGASLKGLKFTSKCSSSFA